LAEVVIGALKSLSRHYFKTGHQSRRKSALQLKKIQQNEEEFLCEP
jgi:hypothetical protein